MKTIQLAVLSALVLFLAGCSGFIPNTGQRTGSVVTQISATDATSPAVGLPVPASSTQVASPTQAPACVSPANPTIALTEGPFFKANSPERTSLVETGMPGSRLALDGYVLTPDCKPVANAKLDFWQANSQGQYDNSGYGLRGHQFTDATGHFHLETILPGEYPGRTEHIHVKIQAPNGPVLTTQLFFPGVSGNQTDQIFDPSLVVTEQKSQEGIRASFNFVVNPQ
jgi:protocatechuate 3,4-dioxygenase beta subunit